MTVQQIAETIFTIVMLLFLSIMVLGILVGVSLVQELADMNVGWSGQFIFIAGMFLTFVYIIKLIIDKIRDFHRFSKE